MKHIKMQDPEIYTLIKQEEKRQYENIRLIPSENYTSKSVMEASATILANKYSEGYPGKRYYEGQKIIDQIELIAIKRAKKLFKAEHANVQALSGSPANMALYFSFLNIGDKIMGLSLPHGGHLTHGWPVSFSGKLYKSIPYTLNKETSQLDYDQIRDLAKKERPKMIIAGASAYPRIINFSAFSEIAKEVNAFFIADIAHIAGLIAGEVHPNPFPYADAVSSTTHKTLRGPRGGLILSKKKYAKNIDKAIFPTLQGGPHQQTICALAIALQEAETKEFKSYTKQVIKNAKVLAEKLLEYDFNLVTGGTDNHLILIDLNNKNVSGKIISKAMDNAGLVCNYNSVPYDKRNPFDPSGIRLGTPAITSRNMKEKDMEQIALWINQIVENYSNEKKLTQIKEKVKEFSNQFIPLGMEKN